MSCQWQPNKPKQENAAASSPPPKEDRDMNSAIKQSILELEKEIELLSGSLQTTLQKKDKVG